jgi:hypothetical protein
MRQDEIQNRQLRAHVFDRMLAAIAEIFATDGAIEQAGEEVVDTTVSKQ